MENFIERRSGQLPPDSGPGGEQVARAQSQYDATPPGPVSLAYDVRAVYDSRPVNGYDFNIEDSTAVTVTNPEDFILSADVSFTVPFGLVCVLKETTVWLEPAVNFANPSDSQVTFKVNRASVLYNENLSIDSDNIGNPLKTFIVADEGSEVGVHYAGTNLLDPGTPNLRVLFHGQFLRKTNVPVQFEVANAVPGRAASSNLVASPSPVAPMPDSVPTKPIPTSVSPTVAPILAPAPTVDVSKISWGYTIDSHPRQYTPMLTVGKKKRRLTPAEEFEVRDFLNATRPPFVP
jgi:hypothetical protein